MRIFIFIFFIFFTYFKSTAQTAGSGTLSTIESLVQKEIENSKQVGELNRKHADTYISEDLKQKRLIEELADLEKKKSDNDEAVKGLMQAKLDEIENGQAWKNRRASAQSGWKEKNPGACGAGGPPPICPVDHWYRVSVSEAMAEYNALVEKELDKVRNQTTKYDKPLSNKRAELQDFQFGENEFYKKRKQLTEDMNKLTSENTDIREEIAKLSKVYVTKIEAEIKSTQNAYIRDLMNEIATSHYTIVKIGIIEVKIIELNEEERKAEADLRDKLTKQNDKKIEEQKNLALLKSNELIDLETNTNAKVSELNTKLAKSKRELYDIEQDLKLTDLSIDRKNNLEARKSDLSSLIGSIESQIESLNSNYISKKSVLDGEILKHKNESWNLLVNLPSLITKAVEALKEAYTVKREILEDALAGRKAKLITVNENIPLQKDIFRKKAKAYADLVEPERIRLMDACKESGASCWGSDITGKIWQHTNMLLDCAASVENKSIMYTGCEEASSHYNSYYQSLMSGVSDEDLGKLIRSNPSNQYKKILEKF